MTTLKTVALDTIIPERAGQNGILTLGATTPDGRRLVGVFSSEADARSADADSLALAIVAMSDLSPVQQMIADENSDSL